jgi:hypothetical protein
LLLEDIFTKRPHEYKSQITNPVADYINMCATIVSKVNNISFEEAKQYTKEILSEKKKNGELNNPVITHTYRKENGDKIMKKTPYLTYLKDTLSTGQILAPSFTVYSNPEVKQSLLAMFLESTTSTRKIHKKAAFKAKMEKDVYTYLLENTKQLFLKLLSNSLSGVFGSKGTILGNVSAHYGLTSITRTATSIANATAEAVVGGNFFFSSPNEVFSYVTSLLYTMPKKEIDKYFEQFPETTIPTPQQVLDVYKFSTKYYWVSDEFDNDFLKVVGNLTPKERAFITYANNLKSFRDLNDGLMRGFIDSVIQIQIVDDTDENLKLLYSAPEYIVMFAKHILYDDLQGVSVNYDKMRGSDTLKKLIGTVINIGNNIINYTTLFRAFIRVDAMMPAIGKIKEMLRVVTVLSDTDSTVNAFDTWIEWYNKTQDYEMSSKNLAIATAIMTVNSQALEHKLKILTTNMNVAPDKRDKITYKSEFFWWSLTTMNGSKHYVADTAIKEGNVYDETELELKGGSLIGSNAPLDVQKMNNHIYNLYHEEIRNGVKIDQLKYMKVVADKERELRKRFIDKDPTVFFTSRINRLDGYKERDGEKYTNWGFDSRKSTSNYFHYEMWEELFKERYGAITPPPYLVAKVSVNLDTAAKMKRFYNESKYGQQTKKFMEKHGKDKLTTLLLPFGKLATHWIPEEFLPYVDVDRMINNNLKSMYMFFEATLDIYRKPNYTYEQMGY